MVKTTQQRTVARRFVERAAALELKGVKRDNAALDYFCGAAAGAELAGDPQLAHSLGVIAALIVSVRGYIGVQELANEKDDDQ